MKTINTVLLSALTVFSCTKTTESFGFGKPTQTTLETHSEVTKDGKLEVNLKVKILDEKVNGFSFEGTPWSLKIKKSEGANFSSQTFDEKALDHNMPGYKITSDGNISDSGKIEYSLVAFVCTKDKTRCYREAHNGTYDWKK